MTARLRCTPGRGRERGVALIVGLVVLTVLSLMAIGSMRATTLEERMTHNSQDRQIAFQVAEAALREAEAQMSQPMLPQFLPVTDAAADGYYLADVPTLAAEGQLYQPLWQRSASHAVYPRWQDSAITADAPPAPIDRARGQFLVEQLQVVEEAAPGESLQSDAAQDRRQRTLYRITARAWGATTANEAAPVVLLQSTFKR